MTDVGSGDSFVIEALLGFFVSCTSLIAQICSCLRLYIMDVGIKVESHILSCSLFLLHAFVSLQYSFFLFHLNFNGKDFRKNASPSSSLHGPSFSH